jgi:hypothetical protein
MRNKKITFLTGGCMNLVKGAGIILVLASLQGVLAQDTTWICREDTMEVIYVQMSLADTFPDNRGQFTMVDTGGAIEGKYVNFDYQFSNDSVYLKGKDPNTGAEIVYHCAPRPGYAGFKLYWDNGVSTFSVDDYDSMVLWHKGPLTGHKVKMIWAQGSAGCGTPINYQYFGEFKSSSTWKRESFAFPSGFIKHGLLELRMLIYNDETTGTTSPTSVKGNLKIDNMCFLNGPPHAPVFSTQPQSKSVEEGDSVTFSAFAYGGSAGSPTYQWQKDNSPITDANSLTYTIASVKSSDAGSYRVVVTNSNGSTNSDAATLTITAKEDKKGCGCGSGTGMAIIPPLFFKAMANRKRKKKNLRA